MPMTRTVWFPERESILRTMWEAGATSGQIAARLKTTQDSVTSHARFIGLTPRKGGKRTVLKTYKTPWELRPLPKEPAVAEMDAHDRRFANWARAKKAAGEALRA